MSSSPITVTNMEILNSSQEMPVHKRLERFVENIDDILCNDEYDEKVFMKILEISMTNAYNFKSMEPMPSLADCCNILIRDQRKFQENTKLYHYYDAMVSWFVMTCLEHINAKPEHVQNLRLKMRDSIYKFKNFERN